MKSVNMSKDNKGFFATKSEWAVLKDALLEEYLVPYLQKILATRKPLLYIDGFAGKGKFDDGAVGSPLIACNCIESALERTTIPNARIDALFIEPEHEAELQKNICVYPFAKSIKMEYQVFSSQLMQMEGNRNLFIYADPFGIKYLRTRWFNRLTSVFDSVEILLNFNSFGFFREACRAYGIEFNDVENFDVIKERFPWSQCAPGEASSILNEIIGGDFWRSIVEKYKNREIDGYTAEVELSECYRKKLNTMFEFALDVPIRMKEGHRPKYRMYHLSNHPEGCLLMYNNMYKRLGESQIIQKQGQMCIFDLDAENNVVSEDRVLQRLGDFLDTLEKDTQMEEVIAEFIAREGIALPLKSYFDYAKRLESEGQIAVKRIPGQDAFGKKLTYMHSGKGKMVYVKRREEKVR